MDEGICICFKLVKNLECWINIFLLVKILKLIINEFFNVMEVNVVCQVIFVEWS